MYSETSSKILAQLAWLMRNDLDAMLVEVKNNSQKLIQYP